MRSLSKMHTNKDRNFSKCKLEIRHGNKIKVRYLAYGYANKFPGYQVNLDEKSRATTDCLTKEAKGKRIWPLSKSSKISAKNNRYIGMREAGLMIHSDIASLQHLSL